VHHWTASRHGFQACQLWVLAECIRELTAPNLLPCLYFFHRIPWSCTLVSSICPCHTLDNGSCFFTQNFFALRLSCLLLSFSIILWLSASASRIIATFKSNFCLLLGVGFADSSWKYSSNCFFIFSLMAFSCPSVPFWFSLSSVNPSPTSAYLHEIQVFLLTVPYTTSKRCRKQIVLDFNHSKRNYQV